MSKYDLMEKIEKNIFNLCIYVDVNENMSNKEIHNHSKEVTEKAIKDFIINNNIIYDDNYHIVLLEQRLLYAKNFIITYMRICGLKENIIYEDNKIKAIEIYINRGN